MLIYQRVHGRLYGLDMTSLVWRFFENLPKHMLDLEMVTNDEADSYILERKLDTYVSCVVNSCQGTLTKHSNHEQALLWF